MKFGPIQVEASPNTDHLSAVVGVQPSTDRCPGNVRFFELKAGPGVNDKTVFRLRPDNYYAIHRAGGTLYFYTKIDRTFERLSESEFLGRVYKRFRLRSALKPGKVTSINRVEEGEEEPEFEGLREFCDPAKWNLKPETDNYWRDTQKRYRAIIRRAAGSYTAIVFYPKGRSLQCQLRNTLEEAKADAWRASLDLDRDDWPVCTECGGQEFDDEGCLDGCGFSTLGDFPRCPSCDDRFIHDHDMTMCFECDSRFQNRRDN